MIASPHRFGLLLRFPSLARWAAVPDLADTRPLSQPAKLDSDNFGKSAETSRPDGRVVQGALAYIVLLGV